MQKSNQQKHPPTCPKRGMPLTIWRELVPLKDCDAEHILLQILDKELTVRIPLRIEGVLYGLGDMTLTAHGHFTVWVTLS